MRVVILGTGTAVGKTSVTCDLARGLQSQEHPVLALKPVETGFAAAGDGSPLPGSDAAQLEAAVFHVQHPRPHPLYALRDGISPHLAAEHEDRLIDLEAIQLWLSRTEQQASSSPALVTLIETAGGMFSPLSPTTRNCDLALALQAELWLLVAPDRLGVLHDVAATLGALAPQGRRVDCVAVVPPTASDASTGSNAEQLRRLHPGLPVIGHALRRDGKAPTDCELVRWVAAQRAR